jgi:Tfp pilus assembly protein PilN
MAREINLLPEKELVETRLESLQKKLIILSAVLIFIFAGITIFTFVNWRQQVLANEKLKKEIDLSISEISTYQRPEFLLRTLKEKIGKYSQIVGQRRNYSKTLSDVESLVPEGVSLSDLQLTKDNKISLTGEARNSFDLSVFLLGIIDPDKGGKLLNDVSIGKLTGAKDGTYQFAVSAVLAGENIIQ